MPSYTRKHAMNVASTTVFPALILALVYGQAALAEEFRIVSPDAAQACQSGAKSEEMTLDAPKEIQLARAKSDTIAAAVCLAPGSDAAVQVTWRANGYWRNSGTVSHDCTEILGASKVKLRPVETNFHGTATYYTCVKE